MKLHDMWPVGVVGAAWLITVASAISAWAGWGCANPPVSVEGEVSAPQNSFILHVSTPVGDYAECTVWAQAKATQDPGWFVLESEECTGQKKKQPLHVAAFSFADDTLHVYADDTGGKK